LKTKRDVKLRRHINLYIILNNSVKKLREGSKDNGEKEGSTSIIVDFFLDAKILIFNFLFFYILLEILL